MVFRAMFRLGFNGVFRVHINGHSSPMSSYSGQPPPFVSAPTTGVLEPTGKSSVIYSPFYCFPLWHLQHHLLSFTVFPKNRQTPYSRSSPRLSPHCPPSAFLMDFILRTFEYGGNILSGVFEKFTPRSQVSGPKVSGAPV